MKVRVTKLPATETQGARLRASVIGTRAQTTIPYPYDANDPMIAAVRALVGDGPNITRERESGETGNVYNVSE